MKNAFATHQDTLFGRCPKCGRNDGFFNVGAAHWFVCHVHGICWCVGSNLFPCWRFEDQCEWQGNREMLSSYESVDPQHRVLSMASPAWVALPELMAYCRGDRLQHEQSDRRRRQILGCLQDLDEWFSPGIPEP